MSAYRDLNGVLILSGGLDSTVLMYHLLAEGVNRPLRALTIDYGQRHFREIRAARQIVEDLNEHAIVGESLIVEHHVLDLAGMRPLLAGSSQTDSSVDVPEGHYAEESMKLTIVPNRNMLMLAAAGSWAISTKSQFIAYAAHAGDHAIYPDCRSEFVNALSDALWLADWHHVRIERPFVYKTKAEIVARGAELGVPFAQTWSCYQGGRYHCGKCGTCVERIEAFKLAGVTDPTVYYEHF